MKNWKLRDRAASSEAMVLNSTKDGCVGRWQGWWRGQSGQFHVEGRKRPEGWEVGGKSSVSGVGLGVSRIFEEV